MDEQSNTQQDPVQLFMDGVSHLTGYLHRSLTLMKELDLQATEIGRTLKEKEEEYICRLHQRKKRKHPEEVTSSETNSVNNPGTNYDTFNERSRKINKDLTMLQKKKDYIGSDAEDANKKEQNKQSFRGIKLKIRREHLEDENQKENVKGEEKEKHITNSENPTTLNKTEDTVTEKGNDIRKNENKENEPNMNSVFSVDQEGEIAESKRIKIDIKYSKELENMVKEETPKDLPEGKEKKEISHNRVNNLNNDYLRNNSDSSEDEQETEEMKKYFIEINSDRNKCMDLLREKISINNQISLMIKQDYEKLKKQFDNLYAEMEKKGESFNSVQDGLHLNKYSFNDLENYFHSTSNHAYSYTNEHKPSSSYLYSSVYTKNRNNYSRYNSTVHNIEQKQKNEENESVSSKSVYRSKNFKNMETNNTNEKIKRNKKSRKNKKEPTNETTNSNENSQITDLYTKPTKNINEKSGTHGLKINTSTTSKGSSTNKLQTAFTNNAPYENEEKNKNKNKSKSNVNHQNSLESIGNISSLSTTKKKQTEKSKTESTKEKNKATQAVSTISDKNNTQKAFTYSQEKKISSSDETQQKNNNSFTADCNYIKEDSEEGICPVCEKGESAFAEFEMVCCDACNKWFHFECVNYQNDDGDENWFCPKCLTTDATVVNKTASNTNMSTTANNKKDKK